ncbi:MAG: diguanylate phosphodiesterase [Achromobacter sp.]|uniref:diguanylate phosphodiesterase n=1 Tax=Achromobacter sp. TaxID=134375 RepID=UPI003D02CB25
MLSTLIYRSRACEPMSADALDGLIRQARARNASLNVTGLLLFDGVHFVQLLEGPAQSVESLFDTIGRDARHKSVVRLLRDHGPFRRFEGDEMAMVDLRDLAVTQVASLILEKMKKQARLAVSDDRVIKILTWYALARDTSHIVEGEDAANWRFVADEGASSEPCLQPGQTYQFALQPIVEPARRAITSFEFLIRSQSGGSPEQLFASVPPAQRYRIDLESKAFAFRLASRLCLDDIKLSVNLLPMSLVADPSAVDLMLDQIAGCGLSPGQVIVEITEQEAIVNQRDFGAAIERLRRAGIGVAIDDFGAGFAGLSLLADFQPDKLKIDRKIIQNIHADGPRQAIVRAIVEACAALGITPVAEGVERVEEWCWLQAAGVERFQGYLFARPALNGVPAIHWPQRTPPH